MATLRLEITEFRADAAQAMSGALRGMATLAMPGVYTYSDGSKTWDEYVPPSTLAAQRYLDSVSMAPVTMDHPRPPVVTADNAKALTIGALGAATLRADGRPEAPIHIWDRAGAQAARTSHPEVSLGYAASVEWTPGITPDGRRYDAIQTMRENNHVAIVPRGRHGPAARVTGDALADTDSIAWRIDAAEKIDSTVINGAALPQDLADRSGLPQTNGEPHMAKLKIGAVEYEVPDAVAAPIAGHIDGLTTRADKAATAEAALATVEGARDAALAEVAALKTAHAAELVTVRADAIPAARARIELESQCAKVCGKDWTPAGKTDLQCQLEALAALKVPVARADSAEYVAGAFEFALRNATAPSTGAVVAAGMNSTVRADAAAEETADDRLAKAMEAQRKALR